MDATYHGRSLYLSPDSYVMISKVLAAIITAAVVLVGKDVYMLARILAHPYFSPMRAVNGPPNPKSDYDTLLKEDPLVMDRWAQEYGPIYRYSAQLKVCPTT